MFVTAGEDDGRRSRLRLDSDWEGLTMLCDFDSLRVSGYGARSPEYPLLSMGLASG